MAPRSLDRQHPTDIVVTETRKYVEFRPVCRCGPVGDKIRLNVPYRGQDRIAAYAKAIDTLRAHEHAMGVGDNEKASCTPA